MNNGLGERIRRLTRQDFRASERDRQFYIVISAGIGPAILGLWGAACPEVWKFSPTLVILISAAFVLIQILAFCRTLDRPQTLGSLLVNLSDIEIELDYVKKNLESTLIVTERLYNLQGYALGLQELRMTVLPTAEANNCSLKEFFGTFLNSLGANVEASFGMSDSDIWNFAVYLYYPENDILKPVWRLTDPRHPSAQGVGGREWRPGIGHVGLAFRRNEAIYTEDANWPDVKSVLAGSEAAKDYDERIYRSFASIPFGVADAKDPAIGVIVGTSSRAGSFSDRTSLPLLHAAALFSGMTATIEQLRGSAGRANGGVSCL